MHDPHYLTGWRRSRRCDNGHCVEVARTRDGIAVRDSKNPEGNPLQFPPAQWHAFMVGVQAGDFDRC